MKHEKRPQVSTRFFAIGRDRTNLARTPFLASDLTNVFQAIALLFFSGRVRRITTRIPTFRFG
jgi:hypothetical protein